MPLCPRCPSLLVAVPLAAVHALCSNKGCEKPRKVCQSERGAGAEAAPVLVCRRVMQRWRTSATRAPSASQPQEPEWMKQRQQCACVRACVRVYTALKMRDGDLSGPARSGTSKQAEECFTTKGDILEYDKNSLKWVHKTRQVECCSGPLVVFCEWFRCDCD